MYTDGHRGPERQDRVAPDWKEMETEDRIRGSERGLELGPGSRCTSGAAAAFTHPLLPEHTLHGFPKCATSLSIPCRRCLQSKTLPQSVAPPILVITSQPVLY